VSEYFVPIARPRKKSQQLAFETWTEDRIQPNEFINRVRGRVELWRRGGYVGITRTTRRLLEHWQNPGRECKLFFCQIEALETAIYVTEVARRHGDNWIANELHRANAEATPLLYRVAFKMATGSGKTVVMAILIAWHALNKMANRQDVRFSDAFLVVTPGITIRDRLRVLLPSDPNNYYRRFDVLPLDLMPQLHQAKFVVTNFHAFQLREKVKAGRLTKELLAQGEASLFTETPGQMVRRVCRELGNKRNIVVLSDEGHHCYRRKPDGEKERLSREERGEARQRDEEARVWILGLETVRAKLQARVGDAAGATVRRVASHTAGLPLHSQHFYDDEPHRLPPMDETVRRYGNLVTEPGERYQYSNLGYGILGYVISRESGRDYADFMQDEVFVPLGMDHTSVHVGPGLDEGQAVKYTPGGLVVPPCDSDSPGASAIYGSAHDLVRFAMFHLKNDLLDQEAIISDAAIDAMQNPSPETGPTRGWEREGSGYGIGWFVGVTEDGLRVVQHSGGTVGVSTVLALVPEEDLAVAVLSNTQSPWPDATLIEIVCTLLSLQPEGFLPPADRAAGEPPFVPGPELVGRWEGLVHTHEGENPLVLEIGESGSVYAALGDQSRTLLQDVSYRDKFPQFLNAGGGPFLRGWMQGELETADVKRGRPYNLWIEFKLRENALNGSLISFSQREMYIGPLAHWVQLRGE
jgi:hypothetical protein